MTETSLISLGQQRNARSASDETSEQEAHEGHAAVNSGDESEARIEADVSAGPPPQATASGFPPYAEGRYEWQFGDSISMSQADQSRQS